MSGKITWVRSLVFSNYLLNYFMIVCGFLEVLSVNWRCMERLVMRWMVGKINLWYGD